MRPAQASRSFLRQRHGGSAKVRLCTCAPVQRAGSLDWTSTPPRPRTQLETPPRRRLGVHAVSMRNPESAQALSELYAVVLSYREHTNVRVKWSPDREVWLANHPAFADEWVDAPGVAWISSPNAPADDEFEVALQIAPRARERCNRCGLTDPSAHFIALNVYGIPTLYCVQAPSADIVGSRGGGGRSEHWGGPLGCRNVSASFEYDWGPDIPYIGTVAVNLYGQPLIAEEVINWPWCTFCTNAAGGPASAVDIERIEFMRELVGKREKWVASQL